MFFFLILKNKSRDYLLRIILQRRLSYIKRNSDEISLFKAKHTFYKYWFFLKPTTESNNLDQDRRNRKSYNLFHFSILKFNRPPPNSFYDCQNIIFWYSLVILCYQTSPRFESFTRTQI